jgi:hypothetical protein
MFFEPDTRSATVMFVLTWAGFAVFMLLASGHGTQLALWVARS